MNETNSPPIESIPGYRLLDRLGQGGYGEVWRAEAPGGMIKAIKFIFGRQDGTRAVRELKALERIREVRHPFLLSLERIEVVDGRMMVVTELADGSLRDRLIEAFDAGGHGIPRPELLRYLHEAADALDYLRDHHSLQHLDVKPENILLLSGHVKVADFGLVKSLDVASSESIVGGMTPTYAAPEVFRGAPTGASDQYSLAVVYQELLTGTVPFNGASTAELTLQHLNEEPDLSPLSESDRFVVSRALAKRPDYRFGSCSEFVQTLASGLVDAPEQPAARPPGSATTVVSRITASDPTQAFDALDDSAWNGPASPILFELDPPAPTAAAIEPPRGGAIDEEFALTPALFIGIGGSSGRVLRLLRQRMSAELGLTGPLPAMPFLLLDVDQASLSLATQGADKGSGLLAAETVSLPLKRPQQYRAKADQLLDWLGRRWLYNIPRSARTEGIRPLGRLALIDHARQAMQRIRRALNEAATAESLAASQRATGVPFRAGGMRVYVVASISGGAAGGMAFDVAYATRAILSRSGIGDAKLLGLLTYSSARESERGELSRVNAYSAMTELCHLSRTDVAYPGDVGSGLPPASADTPPFDASYLLDFGASADDPHCVSTRSAMVDYLLIDSLTATQRLLDERRSVAHGPARVRSFRVEEVQPPREGVDAGLLVRRLYRAWLQPCASEPNASEPYASDHEASQLLVADVALPAYGASHIVTRHQIDAEGILALARKAADGAGGEIEQAVRAMIGSIGGWIAEKLNSPGPRLSEATIAARWMLDHVSSIEREAASLQGDVADTARRAALIARRVRDAVASMDSRLTSIFQTLRVLAAPPGGDADQAEEGLAALLDQRLQAEYFELRGGAARVLSDPELFAGMSSTALGIAQRLVEAPHAIEAAAVEARPQQPRGGIVAEDFGGVECLIHAFPGCGQPAGPPTVAVVECEGISLPHLAAHIVGHRQDYARFAERVHSRRDIAWEPLVELSRAPSGSNESSAAPMPARLLEPAPTMVVGPASVLA